MSRGEAWTTDVEGVEGQPTALKFDPADLEVGYPL